MEEAAKKAPKKNLPPWLQKGQDGKSDGKKDGKKKPMGKSSSKYKMKKC